jgi:hypothetical protein
VLPSKLDFEPNPVQALFCEMHHLDNPPIDSVARTLRPYCASLSQHSLLRAI